MVKILFLRYFVSFIKYLFGVHGRLFWRLEIQFTTAHIHSEGERAHMFRTYMDLRMRRKEQPQKEGM